MQTILDFTKEIVNEIYKHDDHWNYTIVIEPYSIQLTMKDLYVEYTIMLSKMDFLLQIITNSVLPTQHLKLSKKPLILFLIRKEPQC